MTFEEKRDEACDKYFNREKHPLDKEDPVCTWYEGWEACKQELGWQPIETYKDELANRRIDLWCEPKYGYGFRVGNCLWSEDLNNWVSVRFPKTKLRNITHWSLELEPPANSEGHSQPTTPKEKADEAAKQIERTTEFNKKLKKNGVRSW